MTQDSRPDDDWDWETPEQRRPRRLDEDGGEYSFPIVWLLIGGLAGLLTIGLIALGVVRLVSKQQPAPTPTVLPTAILPATPTTASLMEATSEPTPTVEALPTAPQVINTPTTIPPTPTSAPVEAESVPPAQIQVGSFVKVVNTGGAGLNLRSGPGRANEALVLAEADAVLEVVGGPADDSSGATDDNGAVYKWWNVKYSDGTQAWARGDFLEPTTAP